jgi:hypothetical protein
MAIIIQLDISAITAAKAFVGHVEKATDKYAMGMNMIGKSESR